MRIDWKNLEERLETIDGNELREELLESIDFVLGNFGLPKDYYDNLNPDIEKINERIYNMLFVRDIIFAEEHEDTVKRLYLACSGEEDKENGKQYKMFYKDLWDNLNFWSYGDKLNFKMGNFPGEYTWMKNRLLNAKRLLETGKILDIISRYDAYLSELKKISELKKRDSGMQPMYQS